MLNQLRLQKLHQSFKSPLPAFSQTSISSLIRSKSLIAGLLWIGIFLLLTTVTFSALPTLTSELSDRPDGVTVSGSPALHPAPHTLLAQANPLVALKAHMMPARELEEQIEETTTSPVSEPVAEIELAETPSVHISHTSAPHTPTPEEVEPETEIDSGYRLVIHAGSHHHPDLKHPKHRSEADAAETQKKHKSDKSDFQFETLPSKEDETETPLLALNLDEKLVPPPAAGPRPGAHWTYSNPKTGPYNWGNLDPNYAICASGMRQSPIDFKVPDAQHLDLVDSPGAVKTDPTLSHILFNYSPSNVTLIHHDNVTHIDDVLNNGHTIQVNYESGSEIFIKDKRYDLMQFHFHSPSEHTLNTHHFDMEMHLVHQHFDDKSLAVVGVWLEIPHGILNQIHELRGQYINIDDLTDETTADQPELRELLHKGSNPFLDSLNWAHIPKAATEFNVMANSELNIFDILPFDQGYMTYEGSLTTPPCSEIVTWYMLKNPITCSLAQKNTFQAIFGQNARPTQVIHGRNVTQTVDSVHTTVVPTGVSHDLFLGLMGSLIVVSLLLLFAMIFICTRTQHRLGRPTTHGPVSSEQSKLYAILSPHDEHQYAAINPLEDELENGNRYQANAARAQAQAYSNSSQPGDATLINGRTNANHGQVYGSL